MENSDPNSKMSRPKTDSEKCKDYRERKKLKLANATEISLLEQAKAELRASASLDLDEILRQERFINAFNADILT